VIHYLIRIYRSRFIHSRVVILTFDAMAIDPTLRLNMAKDEVDGFIDLGPDHGRRAIVASNVLAFMVRSVTTKWKQVGRI